MADIGFDHIGHSDGTGHDQLHGVVAQKESEDPDGCLAFDVYVRMYLTPV